jgi:nucleotide-binding universal stress UspA family protein
MKTILLPTDFSDTAFNAAQYAIQLARQVAAEKIVLYHAYQTPVNVVADPIMTVGLLDIDTLRAASETGVEEFKKQLEPYAGNMELETITEFSLLSSGINDASDRINADLIIMGITGAGALEETLMGSNTIHVAKHTKVPVMIIPAECKFKSIEKVLLVSDFKEVEKNTPVDLIKKILNDTKSKLFVLHVNDGSEQEEAYAGERVALHDLMREYNPQIDVKDGKNFSGTVNEYATEIAADIIITIPKKHGLFEALFKRSHSKALAFHSHIPLMVVHK